MSLVTFEQARANPELRQAYLDSIDLEEHGRYVKEVSYGIPVENTNCLHIFISGSLMFCWNPRSNYAGTPSDICVFPAAFNYSAVGCDGDLRSLLVDHEGRHARQIFETGMTLSHLRQEFGHNTAKDREAELEIDAYEYQLDKIRSKSRTVSPELKLFLKRQLRYYRGRLK